MLKNPTPGQVALYAASILSFFVFISVFLLQFFRNDVTIVLIIFLLPVISFVTSYFIFLYFLQRYIYRKIKLIYKNIHRFKSAPDEKSYAISMNKDIISVVEKEVQEWADEQSEEIASLKEMENYRKAYMGNISHELKTPIFNIQGFVHTLLDGGLHDESINMNYLRRAAKNVERLQTIVEDLEVISRLESGQMILEPVVFDIKKLVDEVFEDLEFKAKEKNIRLTLKDGASQPFRVRADRESIRHVMINLIDNSLKYGKSGGYTKVGFYDMDSNILIEISDNGIGIGQDHISHVFDRFYRVDKSRSREAGGSGLGLSIVKHIIEAHKQTINLRSTEGVGSTFGFTLEKA